MEPDNKNYQRLMIESMVSQVPDEKLESVLNFIESCLDRKEKKNIEMKGIWKGLGFEDVDLENELKKVRQSSLQDLEKELLE